MSTDALDRLERLFLEARARPPEERAAYLAAACPDDPDLRREVEQLLAADDEAVRDGFLSALDDGLSAPADSLVGTRFGPYEVQARLGGGGMGVVYKALDTHLRRPVALKVLAPHLGMRVEATARFMREAEVISALDHPNICTLYDLGETGDGRLFMTMPHYEGEPLDQRLARGPLPIQEALRIAQQVASGLACAHEAGIIHRDLKPANLFCTSRGEVKILDFGIAKLEGATRLTKTGSQIGTAAYMSPEQAQGEAVDARTDLWSLGVVLYEMLAGVRPFHGERATAMIYSIVHDEPVPLRDFRPDAPLSLVRIVERLLQKNPDGRYPDGEALLADLRAADASVGDESRAGRWFAPSRPHHTRRWAYAAAAVVVVLLALVGWGLFDRGPSPVRSVAVLPLAYLSGEADRAYVADGMTEALIATMGQIEALRVISRTSAMRYRDTDKSLPEIARELGVDAVVEGTVALDADRMQIRVRLLEAATERRLWEERFERPVRDVVAMQQDVARAIAGAIEMELTADDEARFAEVPQVDPAAFDLYLKGLQALNERSEAYYQRAAAYFERSVAIDSSFAPAHARLAVSLALVWSLPPDEVAPKARRAVEAALRIDPSLSEAYVAQGLIRQFFDRDWEGAYEAFRQAIQWNPGNDDAHHELSMLLLRLRRFDEALAAERQALYFNPLSAANRSGIGEIYLFSGNYRQAVAVFADVLAQEPDRLQTRYWLSRAYWYGGYPDEAIEEWEKSGVDRPLVERYAAAELREEALQEIENLVDRWQRGERNQVLTLAMMHAVLGNKDRALDWLERAYAIRLADLVYLDIEPVFHSLRSEPRFRLLLQRLGFGDAMRQSIPTRVGGVK